jgi:hypothetical protein
MSHTHETQEILAVTPQRRERGKMVEAPRDAQNGGIVASMGQHDAWAFYPDFLMEMRLLGGMPEAARRRNAAFAFAELWAQTHRSEKSNVRDAAAGGQPGERPTEEGDVDSDSALYEAEWLLVQMMLGDRRELIEWLAIEAVPPTYPLRLDGIAALKRSDDPKDLRLAATLIEKHKEQVEKVTAHMKFFMRRSGEAIDALDALEGIMEKANLETWKKNEKIR